VFSVGIGALLVGALGCAQAPEFMLVGTMHEIMEGAVAPPTQIIWDSVSTIVDADGIHENFPRTEVEWEIVEHAAIALAESANLLIMEGRARDPAWIAYAHELTRTSMLARDAALAKDTEAILDTGEQIYDVCTGCHRSYIIE
jgi:hypothetical protein